ncbi:MAG: DUF4136 domain-containing protein [Bacteroidota bacterium]|uniref:Lipoprotein, putative n=1 Tax=Christiangramia flava JLT2011 TaxID=1229726 RepID=A0A1L7I7Y0_9FLAO|nr:DUF4136 domain-containing protein [Christiangramia flava]APU69205.1 lipoprotein, putative [Christiangramia flava JLT2011]MEE2770861.1 DUF4136 domain-containing protein [Bacteroidota bacterium]OSS38895.1 putative lipoprotein [Christiangramia flava JLT2011]
MKMLKASLFLVMAMVLFSCGSSAPTAKDDQKKLKSYSTYALLPNKDTIRSREFENDLVQSTIVGAINENMTEQGFSLERNTPDVLVYIHPMFDEKVAVNANPVYTNYSYYRPDFYIGSYYKDFMYDNYFTIQRIDGPRVEQVPYKNKSVVIDFIDRRTNEILWRGTSSEEITDRRLERSLRQYIDDIFKSFP